MGDLQFEKQWDADKVKYRSDNEGRKNANEQNKKTFEASLDKILTAEQKAKYERIKAEVLGHEKY